MNISKKVRRKHPHFTDSELRLVLNHFKLLSQQIGRTPYIERICHKTKGAIVARFRKNRNAPALVRPPP
jgi:hypothetical protein